MVFIHKMADGLTLITSGFSNRLLLTVRKRGLIKKDLVFEFYVYMQVIASQAGGHPTKVMMMMMSFMFLFLSETKLCLQTNTCLGSVFAICNIKLYRVILGGVITPPVSVIIPPVWCDHYFCSKFS